MKTKQEIENKMQILDEGIQQIWRAHELADETEEMEALEIDADIVSAKIQALAWVLEI